MNKKLEERGMKNSEYARNLYDTDKAPLTVQIAKKESLKLWRYLAAHGELPVKEFIPVKMFKKIAKYRCLCPLCALYMANGCVECPLNVRTAAGERRPCVHGWHPYAKWSHADTDDERAQAAGEVVKLLEAWEV